jgi:hypothetical protein
VIYGYGWSGHGFAISLGFTKLFADWIISGVKARGAGAVLSVAFLRFHRRRPSLRAHPQGRHLARIEPRRGLNVSTAQKAASDGLRSRVSQQALSGGGLSPHPPQRQDPIGSFMLTNFDAAQGTPRQTTMQLDLGPIHSRLGTRLSTASRATSSAASTWRGPVGAPARRHPWRRIRGADRAAPPGGAPDRRRCHRPRPHRSLSSTSPPRRRASASRPSTART